MLYAFDLFFLVIHRPTYMENKHIADLFVQVSKISMVKSKRTRHMNRKSYSINDLPLRQEKDFADARGGRPSFCVFDRDSGC